jgi:uncharacterized membrane protein YkvA (DUF1232 family)
MTNSELITTFGEWAGSLPGDATALRAAVEDGATPREAKRHLLGGLSYLLRKIDIVPDYLAGVGVVDDCFVLRLAAKLAVSTGLGDLGADQADAVKALAGACGPVETFLGDLYPKLEAMVKGFADETVRGRTSDKILDDKEAHAQFLRELHDELQSYAPKPITDGERALRDLKSFLKAKLDR